MIWLLIVGTLVLALLWLAFVAFCDHLIKKDEEESAKNFGKREGEK